MRGGLMKPIDEQTLATAATHLRSILAEAEQQLPAGQQSEDLRDVNSLADLLESSREVSRQVVDKLMKWPAPFRRRVLLMCLSERLGEPVDRIEARIAE